MNNRSLDYILIALFGILAIFAVYKHDERTGISHSKEIYAYKEKRKEDSLKIISLTGKICELNNEIDSLKTKRIKTEAKAVKSIKKIKDLTIIEIKDQDIKEALQWVDSLKH